MDQEPPKIEFPCSYPIRVIGEDYDSFSRDVIEIVRQHDPKVSPDEVSVRRSSAKKYLSVRITIWATGEAQLKALHNELMANDAVRMVL